ASQGVRYTQCFVCGSAWMDRDQLQALLAQDLPQWEDDLLEARLQMPQRCRWCDTLYPPGSSHCPPCNRTLEHPCPQDHTPMYIVEEQGIELDVCLTCKGIWFDGRELEQLMEAHGVHTRRAAPGSPTQPHAVIAALEECVICGTPTPVARQVFAEGTIRCTTCHEDINTFLPVTTSPAPQPRPTTQLQWARRPSPETELTAPEHSEGYWEQQDTDLRARPVPQAPLNHAPPSLIDTLTRLLFGQRR
ncbi:MAG: zf-TFIIB domain-containing protein, partial [Myxococcota bacterium]